MIVLPAVLVLALVFVLADAVGFARRSGWRDLEIWLSALAAGLAAVLGGLLWSLAPT